VDGLIPQAWKFAQEYMSQFDPSHDVSHLQRVVSLAQMIYDSSTPQFQSNCDRNLVTLLALLHDVGDKKYATVTRGTVEVENFLLSLNVPKDLATHVQHLVSNVSFSNEQKNKKYVQDLVAKYPELAVVQDADRLDAIGAIGIARVITYGVLKQPQLGWQGIVDHYEEALRKIASEMKTVEGKKIAESRGERIRIFFEDWWSDEYSAMPTPIIPKSPMISTEGKSDMTIPLPKGNDSDVQLEDKRNGKIHGFQTDPFLIHF